jgi:hypothetical protein
MAPLRRIAFAMTLGLLGVGWCGEASAYRPFDGTDASVADTGGIELELGPAGLLREGSQHTLIAPATVFNLGLAEGWEAVLQAQAETTLSPQPTRTSLVGNGLFLKNVLREGVLQEKSGPSIATEFGALLPGINGDDGTGASWAGIVSQRWPLGTAHLNVAAALTREHHADLFLGSILEGPFDWSVRPVAEVFYERDVGALETYSGLIGAIWQAKDALAFDFGVREARINDHTATEVRLGLTIGFRIW